MWWKFASVDPPPLLGIDMSLSVKRLPIFWIDIKVDQSRASKAIFTLVSTRSHSLELKFSHFLLFIMSPGNICEGCGNNFPRLSGFTDNCGRCELLATHPTDSEKYQEIQVCYYYLTCCDWSFWLFTRIGRNVPFVGNASATWIESKGVHRSVVPLSAEP